MRKLILGLISSGLLVGNLLVPALPALAADSTAGRPLDLITSPLPIDLNAKPGTSVSTDLRIKQADGVPETLQVSLLKFGAFGDQGKPQLLDRGPGDDYFDWVTFDKTHFTAPSNVWQTVHMTINVPKSAANGYYYAVTFTRAGDSIRQPGTANSLSGGTAILVLLNAEVPNQKRVMNVVSFSSVHGFYEFLPASFSIKFHNGGNIHLIPSGDIFITKGGSQVAALDYNNQRGNILPNSNRIFTTDWLDGWPHYEPTTKNGKDVLNKKGQTVTHLAYSNGAPNQSAIAPHFRFGRYTAHLLAVYDDGTRDVPLEATISFWVIPWRFLLIVLAAALLIGFGTWALVRGTWRGVSRLGRRGGRRR